MAWIAMIGEEEASGRLKELYEQYWDDSWNGVDNILKLSGQCDTHYGDD